MTDNLNSLMHDTISITGFTHTQLIQDGELQIVNEL